jgi:hypothetical protein
MDFGVGRRDFHNLATTIFAFIYRTLYLHAAIPTYHLR